MKSDNIFHTPSGNLTDYRIVQEISVSSRDANEVIGSIIDISWGERSSNDHAFGKIRRNFAAMIFIIVNCSLNIRLPHNIPQIITTPLFAYAVESFDFFNTICHNNAYITSISKFAPKSIKKSSEKNSCLEANLANTALKEKIKNAVWSKIYFLTILLITTYHQILPAHAPHIAGHYWCLYKFCRYTRL